MPDFVLRIEANAADKDMLTAMADSAKTLGDLGLYLNGRADVTANARILAERGANGAVVVTSPDHLQRAMVDFRVAVAGRIPIAGVIAP